MMLQGARAIAGPARARVQAPAAVIKLIDDIKEDGLIVAYWHGNRAVAGVGSTIESALGRAVRQAAVVLADRPIRQVACMISRKVGPDRLPIEPADLRGIRDAVVAGWVWFESRPGCWHVIRRY